MAESSRGSGIGIWGTSRKGISPAQQGSWQSSSSSRGGPVRIFAETSSMGSLSTIVALSSCSVGHRTSAQRWGTRALPPPSTLHTSRSDQSPRLQSQGSSPTGNSSNDERLSERAQDHRATSPVTQTGIPSRMVRSMRLAADLATRAPPRSPAQRFDLFQTV